MEDTVISFKAAGDIEVRLAEGAELSLESSRHGKVLLCSEASRREAFEAALERAKWREIKEELEALEELK